MDVIFDLMIEYIRIKPSASMQEIGGVLKRFPGKEIEKGMFVSVDLDGTIADMTHRLDMALHGGEPGGHQYYAIMFNPLNVPTDTPIWESRETLCRLVKKYPDTQIVYLSSRPNSMQDATEEWLRSHRFPPGRLVLRSNFQRSIPFKRDQLLKLRAEGPILAHIGDSADDQFGAESAGVPYIPVEANKWSDLNVWNSLEATRELYHGWVDMK